MDINFNLVQDSSKTFWPGEVDAGAAVLTPYACWHGPSGVNAAELQEVHFSHDPTQSLKRFIIKTAPLPNNTYISTGGGALDNTFLLNLDTSQLYEGSGLVYGQNYSSIGTTCSYYNNRRDAGTYPTTSEGVYSTPVPIRGAPLEFRKVYLEGKAPNVPNESPEWDASTTYQKWSVYSTNAGTGYGGTTATYDGIIYKSLEEDNVGNVPTESGWAELQCSQRYFAYFLCSAPTRNNTCGEDYQNTRDLNEQWEMGEVASWEEFDIGSCPNTGGGGGDSSDVNRICGIVADTGDSGYYNTEIPGHSGKEGAWTPTGCEVFSISGCSGIQTRIEGNALWICSTQEESCLSGINTIVTDNGTWTANGCDTLSISGCSGTTTSIINDTLLICSSGGGSKWTENGSTPPDIYYTSQVGHDYGKVGIGNYADSPLTEIFCVSGNVMVSGDDPRIKVDGLSDSHPGLELYEAGTRKWIVYNNYVTDNLTFKTNSTIRMVVEQDGNVGIGTNNPTTKLHVNDGTIQGPTGNFTKSLLVSGLELPLVKAIVSDKGTWNANGYDTLSISGCGGTTTSIENDTLLVCTTGASTCLRTGAAILSTWVEPTSCNIAAPFPLGTPIFQVIPREDNGCTFFDLSGDLQYALSGIGYQEKYVGLCENGVTSSGWILFKGCHDGSP